MNMKFYRFINECERRFLHDLNIYNKNWYNNWHCEFDIKDEMRPKIIKIKCVL